MKRYAMIDDWLIEDTRFVKRQFEPPCVRKRKTVKPGQMYGTVLREAPGKWKMWYLNGRPWKPAMCGEDR